MKGGGVTAAEKGKKVRIQGSEVRQKVLAYTELTAEFAAAAVYSSPGRKRGSSGGVSVRGGHDSKENLPLLLGAEDTAEVTSAGQVLTAPNRDYGPPHTNGDNKLDGDNKLNGDNKLAAAAAVEVKVVEGVQFADQASIEEAQLAKWEGEDLRMEGGGVTAAEKGKKVGIQGSEVRKKVLACTERTAELAAAAVHSSPGRKRGSSGGVSVRGGHHSKEDLRLLLGAEDTEVTSAGQVLTAPNRRGYGPPHRNGDNKLDADNKLDDDNAVDVKLVEGIQFADQASIEALIWNLVQKALEEAQVAKWEGLVDAASVKNFVKRAVEEAHAAMWSDAASMKSLVESVVKEKGLLDVAVIKRFVQESVEEILAAKLEGLPDATAIKSFVQRTVHQVQSERRAFEDAASRNFIVLTVNETVEERVKEAVEETVRKAVVEQHLSNRAPADGISALERMKLVKDALDDHAALSRVLFPLALGFTVPFLIARRNARPSNEELPVSDVVITGMAKEQAFTFLIETVCYAYLLLTHFLHTKGPRLSLIGRRTTSTLISCLVTLWLLFYTYSIPDWLFKSWFWYITYGFLAVNWILTICIGCFSCFVREDHWMDG